MKSLKSLIIKSLIISYLFLFSSSLFALGGNPPPCTPGWKRDQHVATQNGVYTNISNCDINLNQTSMVEQHYSYPLKNSIPNVYSFLTTLGFNATLGVDTDSYQHIYQDCTCYEYVQSYNLVSDSVTTFFMYNSPTTIQSIGEYTIWAKWDDQPVYADDPYVIKKFYLNIWNIDSIYVTKLSDTSVNVNWYTNVATYGIVSIGSTPAYTSSVSSTNSYVNFHHITLTGLSLGSTYHYCITSRDPSNNSLSTEDLSFSMDSLGALMICYVDTESGVDDFFANQLGDAEHPFKTLYWALDEFSYKNKTLDSTLHYELRVCEGTYNEGLYIYPEDHLVKFKGGYPKLSSVPKNAQGLRITDWIENHRNPRRYETIIQSGFQIIDILGGANQLIDGFTLRNTGEGGFDAGGIYAADAEGLVISNNIIICTTGQGFGIAMAGIGTIQNNIIQNYEIGMRIDYLGWSSRVQILNNTILDNTDSGMEFFGYGLNFIPDFGGKLENNILMNNSVGIYASTTLSYTTTDYNCSWNNNSNYIGISTGSHNIQQNPRFTSNGNGKTDGYYLQQIPSDLSDDSFIPLQGTDVTASFVVQIDWQNYINDMFVTELYANSTTNYLGTKLYSYGLFNDYPIPDNASSVSVTTALLLRLYNNCTSSNHGWPIYDKGFVNIITQPEGKVINAYLPALTLPATSSLCLWVTQDGCTYYAKSNHSLGDNINLSAYAAMSAGTTHMAHYTYNHSPCIDAGDPSIPHFGGTAGNFNRDTGIIDIGFHYDWPFIQVSANGKYFEKGDGTPFIPIGHAVFQQIYAFQSNMDTIRPYLKKMQENGENAIRVICELNCNPPCDCTTSNNSQGVHTMITQMATDTVSEPSYNQNMTQWLDQFFALLDEYHLYAEISPMDTPGYARFWDGCPSVIYSKNHNPPGPLDYPYQMFDSSNTVVLYNEKKHYQYCIDHWGHHSGIWTWELISEMNHFWDNGPPFHTGIDYQPSYVSTWVQIVGDYVKTNEISTWGQNRLRTVSSWKLVPDSGDRDLFYKHPALDFIATNAYSIPEITDPSPYINTPRYDPYGTRGAGIFSDDNYIKSIINNNSRPYYNNERCPNAWDQNTFDGHHLGDSIASTSHVIPQSGKYFDDECELNLLWTHYLNGGMGIGYRWPCLVNTTTNPYPNYSVTLNGVPNQHPTNDNHWEYNALNDNMFNHRSIFNNILQQIDGSKVNFTSATGRISGVPGNITVNARGDSTTMIVRFLNTDQSNSVDITATVSGFDWTLPPNQTHKTIDISIYDDETGERVDEFQDIFDGSYEVKVYNLRTHRVLLIKTF